VTEHTVPHRWLWPWLHALSVVVVGSYPFAWRIDPYIYAATIFGGGLVLLGIFTVLLIIRILKRQTPWIDRPALVLIVILIIVHAVAFEMLRTINWA
jgi:hypothetical protein